MSRLTCYLTDADSDLAQLAAKSPRGMAHFAGTGPAGKKCGDCSHLMIHKGIGRCAEYVRLMGNTTSDSVSAPRLYPETSSCKYFAAKQAGRAL
jgi:hypothetical protein